MESSLITEIIDFAHAQGISQKSLAARAGIAEETVSRAKKRGTAHLNVAESLAHAAGTKIGLVTPATARSRRCAMSFRDRYRVALAWSNMSVSNDTLVRRALVNPRFQVLLDAALEFGVDAVAAEWDRLKAEGDPDSTKVMDVTDRILGHIRDGYREAAA